MSRAKKCCVPDAVTVELAAKYVQSMPNSHPAQSAEGGADIEVSSRMEEAEPAAWVITAPFEVVIL